MGGLHVNDNYRYVERFCRDGTEISSKNEYIDYRLIHAAAGYNQADLVERLLDYNGIEVNVCYKRNIRGRYKSEDRNGEPCDPYLAPYKYGYRKVCELLITKGKMQLKKPKNKKKSNDKMHAFHVSMHLNQVNVMKLIYIEMFGLGGDEGRDSLKLDSLMEKKSHYDVRVLFDKLKSQALQPLKAPKQKNCAPQPEVNQNSPSTNPYALLSVEEVGNSPSQQTIQETSDDEELEESNYDQGS